MLASAIFIGIFFQTKYQFQPELKIQYDMSVNMDGYLPLFGGTNGTATVNLLVLVEGKPSNQPNSLAASSELGDVKILFNGATLPFTLDNIKPYFPKTNISLSPEGKVTRTDAPDISLPVRLPGLDVKRFPEISYLPIEFSNENPDAEKWEFKRNFGGSDVHYKVNRISLKEHIATYEVKIEQSFDSYEDESGSTLKAADKAYATVQTKMNGTGTVEFDHQRGLATLYKMKALTVAEVTVRRSGNKSTRNLTTDVNVKLRNVPKAISASVKNPPRYIGGYQLPGFLSQAIDSSQQFLSKIGMQLFFMLFRV